MAAKRPKSITTNDEVDAWFDKLDHPQADAMLTLRYAILLADKRLEECIKWSTPTFTYNGNLASIQPNAKKFVSLMFHRGSEIPGKHPLLEGDARLCRTMKFADAADVKKKKAAIKAVAKAWCDFKDG